MTLFPKYNNPPIVIFNNRNILKRVYTCQAI
jgi:hypothetical protein